MTENYPVNRQAIKDAVNIFGSSGPNTQGKNTITGQYHVDLEDITPIPIAILHQHKSVILGMDVVKINGKMHKFLTS